MMKFFSLQAATLALSLASVLAINTTAHAQNVITNGDFSAGNTGFTSGYTVASPTAAQATFAVVSNPSSVGWASYNDHTTNTAAGSMLVVNGGTNVNVPFWQQTVSVLPNSVYNFSGFVANSTIGIGYVPGTVVFRVNGVAIGSITPNAGLVTGVWSGFSGNWVSGAGATTATLTLTDSQTAEAGNDFTVDDLSFSRVSAVVPEANTVSLLGFALPIIGLVASRRKRSSAAA